MVLISVAMVGLIDGFRSVMGVRGEQNRRTLARMLLEERLDEMEYDGVFVEGVKEGAFPDHDAFRWQSECAETEIGGLYEVKLSVTWNGGSVSALSFLRESLQ